MTVERIRELVEQEIAGVHANIEKVRGSGVYIEHIERWRIHLEAYHKVREMIDRTLAEDALTRKADVLTGDNASTGRIHRRSTSSRRADPLRGVPALPLE